MRFITLFLIALTVFADVTVDPTTVTRSMRAGATYPWISTVFAKKATLTITSADNWTLTKTGTLSTACDGGACFMLRNQANGNLVSSGSGNMTVLVDWANGVSGAQDLTVGEYTGDITVNPDTGDDVIVSLSLTVNAREAYATFSYLSTFPVDCSNSDAGFPHADTCDIPNEYPPASGFSIPAAGATYVDPAFGKTVKRITGPGNVHSYSTRVAFNADSSYIMLSDTGPPDIWRYSDATKIHNDEPGNINQSIWWHWTDPEKYIYVDGALIKERTLGSATVTMADFSGAPWSFTTLSDGGTNDITSDGWIGLISTSTTDVCLLNLNGLTTLNQADKMFCIDYASESLSFIDFPLTATQDPISGKRYLILISQPKQVFYELTGGALVKLENYGEWPGRGNTSDDDGICEPATENCFTVPHVGIFKDSRGVHFIQTFEEVHGSKTYLTTTQINKNELMWRPVEETDGGGLRFMYPVSLAANSDNHFGASDQGWFLASYYGNSNGLATKVIQSATSANPSRVVTTAAHGWSTGQVVVIGSANIACLNIASTITVVNTTTFDVDDADCGAAGAYNANSGIVGVGTTTTDTPNRGEVVAINPVLGDVRRLAHHRSKIWTDTSGADTDITAYNSAPKCSFSRLADKVSCITNFGIPEPSSVIVIETGIVPSSVGTTGMKGVSKIVGKGKIF